MRISIRTALPIAMLLGAFALAGCGGGSNAPADAGDDSNGGERPTNAGDCGEGTKLEGGKCVPDTSAAEMAAANEAARKLHILLGESAMVPNPTPGATPAGFKGAKAADKRSQMMMFDGDKFSMHHADVSAEAAGDLKGYYPLDDTTTLTLSGAKSAAFGDVALQKHDPNVSGAKLFETKGEHMGVSGMFRCNPGGGDCASKGGKPTTGMWYFKPDNADDMVTGAKLEWGWWLAYDTDSGALDMINRFRNAVEASAALDQLGEGTAAYTGDATGQYAIQGDSGAFDAKVSLEATFTGAAPKLSGEVHDFMGADGMARDWTVTLKEHTATDSTGVFADGVTVWDGNEMPMGWNAAMHAGTKDVAPTAILGDFRAHNQGGRMAGVFGAEPE